MGAKFLTRMIGSTLDCGVIADDEGAAVDPAAGVAFVVVVLVMVPPFDEAYLGGPCGGGGSGAS